MPPKYPHASKRGIAMLSDQVLSVAILVTRIARVVDYTIAKSWTFVDL